MEDLFLILILGLIFGSGCVMMALATVAMEKRRPNRVTLLQELRDFVTGAFGKDENTACYMVMCEPNPIGGDAAGAEDPY